MADRISIVIADDHQFIRDGVRIALEKDESLHIVAEATNGPAALERIRSLRPDIAILDIGLPGMGGLEVVRRIRQEQIPTGVVFLTICAEEEVFAEAIELKANGYLLKDCTDTELRRCVRVVSGGQHYADPAMATYLVNRTRRMEAFEQKNGRLGLLTHQERDVLRRIAAGKSSKEIAQDMGLAPKTIDAHRSNICGKLDLHGTNVLSRFASLHRQEL